MTFKEKSEYQLNPDGAPYYTMDRQWYTQPKPYRVSLPYLYDKAVIGGSYSNGTGTSYPATSRLNTGYVGQKDKSQLVINKAYGKIADQLGNQSQMANNIIEAHQSIGMIEARALQIGRFVTAIKRGNFSAASKALSTPNNPRPGIRHKSKDLAGQFLENHFGWEPLIQDMHNAMDTLQKPNFDVQAVKGGSHLDDRADIREEGHSGGFYHLRRVAQINSYHCKIGAKIRINNPNAYLANQMGLINPASIAWEAVPYSFVVDWFGNVGQVLNSMTDFVGIEVLDAYTTLSVENRLWENYVESEHSNPILNGYGGWQGNRIHITRAYGIAGPQLALKPFKGFSLVRGITAVSLLIQKL